MRQATSRRELLGTIAVVVALVVAVCAIFLLARASASRQQDLPANHALSTIQPVQTTAPTRSEATASPSETKVQLSALVESDLARVETALRLYGSYPNSIGKAATLAQLGALVSPKALDEIALQWAGPDVTTVSYQVSNVMIDQTPLPTSESKQLTIEALVTQEATFVNTPATVYLSSVLVTLQQQDGQWQIIHISELGSADSL